MKQGLVYSVVTVEISIQAESIAVSKNSELETCFLCLRELHWAYFYMLSEIAAPTVERFSIPKATTEEDAFADQTRPAPSRSIETSSNTNGLFLLNMVISKL
jgi:hypothetical protein